MKIFILAILITLSSVFSLLIKETTFIGKVTTNKNNKNYVLGLCIEFRVDTIVIAKGFVEENGTFKITSPVSNKIDIYYHGIGVQDTYVKTIRPTDEDTVILNLTIPKEYKRYFGKAVCPKCNKANKTIPIVYGLGSAVLIKHSDNKGDTTQIPYDNKSYYAGSCVTSDIDPKFFCKRDMIKF
jgi:hypothetical protein